jgi:3-methylcrotonyl-CoA carboxylase alpha subunit
MITKINKILIANRGEIACRIARTCRRLGIAAAGVHSDADARALHVRTIGESFRLGGAAPADSYLNIGAIIEAAKQAGADAIHPGYGFLSENPELARAVEAAGLAFIGPTPETLALLGRKDSAKILAAKAGVPVVPGTPEASDDVDKVAAMVRMLRFPVMLKAAGGGGGRGMRVIVADDGLDEAIRSAMREAKSAFGVAALIGERHVAHARHVEVQIAGDGRGNVVHLWERECTLQRRHQKVIEEAPAAPLPSAVREALLAEAVALGRAISLRNLATVEFLVAGDAHYFLEVNPRLQVEHPVTEMVTGRDLVELQIFIAGHGALPFGQDEISCAGHAVEARLCAENPARNFAPSTGWVDRLDLPADQARIEAGIEVGDEITPHYDSMIAKIVTHGETRDAALDAMQRALAATVVHGLETNLVLLNRLVGLEQTRVGTFSTGVVDTLTFETAASVGNVDLAIAAAAWLKAQRQVLSASPWSAWNGFSGWQLGVGLSDSPVLRVGSGDIEKAVRIGPVSPQGAIPIGIDDEVFAVALERLADDKMRISVGERVLIADVTVAGRNVSLDEPTGHIRAEVESALNTDAGAVGSGGTLEAPLMGTLVAINVSVGDRVEAGDVIAVLESMKMEIRVPAPSAGVVSLINHAAGDMVERGALLAEITPDGEGVAA